jgi:hypothetical protein
VASKALLSRNHHEAKDEPLVGGMRMGEPVTVHGFRSTFRD